MPHAPFDNAGRRRNADLACNNMGHHYSVSLSIFIAAQSLLAKMAGNCRVKCDRSSSRHSQYDRSIDHSIYSFLEVASECKCINLLTDRSIDWSPIICPNRSTGSVRYADTDRSWVINSHSLEWKKKIKLRSTISENWKNSIDRCTGDRMILNVRVLATTWGYRRGHLMIVWKLLKKYLCSSWRSA